MASVEYFITQYTSDIIQAWTEQAGKAASARGLEQPAFVNIMPRYLATLPQAVSGQPDGIGRRRRELLENHIGWRLRQGFDLAEVIEEFSLLGRCIARTWTARPSSEQPALTEVERLFAEINQAIVTVMELFQEHMQKEEQGEKRYIRLLHSMADEALRTPQQPLQEWLKKVMALIMEAMRAQTAAILLYERRADRLMTAASVGTAEQELERYASSLSPSSFTGKAAASEEPVSVPDVQTTELEVSEALRQSGIHALLGVRLPAHLELRGVIYVGLREARSFTSREIRRLESLGEQFATLLDNARLYADLRSQAEALRKERDLREQFVSVLAHELRGPLSSVRVAAQLLLRQPERMDERRDLASRIDKNITRLDMMIRDLLDASRLQAGGRLPLRLDTADLGAIAEEVVEEMRVLHGERFILQAESGVRGEWSAEELRRVLWNLLTNAVKYGAPDRPVTLRVQRIPEGARASVHNEGRSIPTEEQERIFELFSRSRHAGQGTQEGWGLGLFLVRGCAEAHGGHVSVRSEPGQGTTFTLELPLDSHPYQPPVQPLQTGSAPGWH
jgi:signal transduction histidine kinase